MRDLLFQPLAIRGLTLPNRIVLTAMVTRLSGEDGHVSQDVIDRYTRFARGEAGLIVVEATAVHDAKSGPLLRLGSDTFIAGHRQLVQQVHDAGPSRVALQIIHFLKIARSGWRQTVDMLSSTEIRAVVDDYAAAAARAREAGYDAVELHMAHAYTLSSFLSRLNRRRDAYGGRSLESRLRLPTEVALAVRKAVGDDYPVGVRFDGEECIKGGYGLAEAKYMGLRLAQAGCDYLSLSAGGKFEDAVPKAGEPLYPYTGYSGDRTMPAAQYQDGPNVYLAAGIKDFLNAQGITTPVVTTGKIPTPRLAEAILQAGQADLVGFARALLADPDWPRKARLDQEDRIVRCVYGNVCKALDERFRTVRCVLWPKERLHAPDAPAGGDTEPPTWPEGAELRAELRPGGQLRLTWRAAHDPQGVYGYEIFRATNEGPAAHLTSGSVTSHVDASPWPVTATNTTCAPTTSPATARCRPTPPGSPYRPTTTWLRTRRWRWMGSWQPRRTPRRDPGRIPPPLAGKVALITGGGRGLGRAIALGLAQDGARVAICARSADQVAAVTDEIAANGGVALGVPADVTDTAAVASMVRSVSEQLGPPLILVNNAGAAVSHKLTAITDEAWSEMLAVNLTAPFLVTRACAPAMLAAGWGRVVNVGSVASLTGARYIAAYTAAKHGLLGLTRALAAEWVQRGITVNLVAPGYVDTPMTDETVANIARRTGRDEEQARQLVAALSPQGRLVTVAEIVPLVRLLARDEAAGITGAVLPVDGGASAIAATG